MELFKNTNFDFLGKKWPFIIASLILTAAGLASLAMRGGPNYGIDFKGGALLYLRFNQEPPVQKIRAALESRVQGEISVQQITGQPEVLVGTEIRNENELNANRQIIEDTLRSTFGAADGKLDLNNSSAGQLADKLREPLLQAGVALSGQELQEVVKNIEAFRASKGGILNSFDQLNGVTGVSPQILAAIKQQCALGPFTILSAEVVGPKIGKDLERQAILATLYALGGMLVYIAFRFEWIYGVAAVLAVFHDVLITLGFFSLLHYEISLTVIAALLTLVGYSMNDTIVIFDRIRENSRLLRKEPFADLVNKSINQTLSRTILTSGLTFLTVLVLFLMGGQVLRAFSFALVVGIVVGTYSSFGIAAPLVVAWNQWRGRGVAAGTGPAAGSKTSGSENVSGRLAPASRK